MSTVNPIVASMVALTQKPKQEPVQEAAEAFRTIQMKTEEEEKAGTATDGRSKGQADSGGSQRPGVPLAAVALAKASPAATEAANRVGGKGLFDPFNSGMSSLLLSAQEATDEEPAPKPDPLDDF